MLLISNQFSNQSWLLLLTFVAGSVHVFSVDHWLPAALLSWQRGWRGARVATLAIIALVLHVAFGAGIYFAFERVWNLVSSARILPFSFAWIAIFTIVRAARLSKISNTFRTGRYRRSAVIAVLAWMGPCEFIVPILMKSRQLGVGFVSPLAMFMSGTLLTGTMLIVFARTFWDRPLWLPWGLNLAHQRRAILPVAACLVIGLTVISRLA